MVQVKIFKTELKPIGPDENIKKLQNEVNKYIKENTTTYDSTYKMHKQKEANNGGMQLINATPLLNNTTFMIVLELGVLNGLEEE